MIRIVYDIETKEVITILLSADGLTAFNEKTTGLLQGGAESILPQALSFGLSPQPILDFIAQNNINIPLLEEMKKTLKDKAFCHELLDEFNAQEQETSVPAETYKAMIDAFRYVLFALQMGNVVQAKSQILLISTTDFGTFWTQAHQDYFVGKINTYLGIV